MQCNAVKTLLEEFTGEDQELAGKPSCHGSLFSTDSMTACQNLPYKLFHAALREKTSRKCLQVANSTLPS